MQLVNGRTKAVLSSVEIADTRATRRRGLLGRDRLEPSCALMLTPCFAVHTAFMRFPIDLVFVDRYGFIVRIVRNVPPWRMVIAPGARVTYELAAGALGPNDARVGDHLYLAPNPGAAAGGATAA